jgi:manganese-dependent inorganic pyrophosphatase
MDSICSALAYARLKQLLGVPDVIAARAGNTNARIDYVLTRFGVESPVFLSDVSPRVSDVMQRDGASVRSDSAVYDAIQLIDDKHLRGLPVVDENRRCVGLLSTFKLNRHLFPPHEEAPKARIVTASLAGILETFGGSVVTGEISAVTSDYLLMVGAMSQETFSHRLEEMAGIIADTLNLSSPTTTPIDKRILARLSDITRVDPFELAEKIFSVGSPLLTLPADNVITTDCKEYEENGRRFTVSQIEELNFSHFEDKRTALIKALDRHQRRFGLLFAALLVTDVNTQNSLLLVCGAINYSSNETDAAKLARASDVAIVCAGNNPIGVPDGAWNFEGLANHIGFSVRRWRTHSTRGAFCPRGPDHFPPGYWHQQNTRLWS